MPPDPGVLRTPFTIGTCVTSLSYRLATGLNNADPVVIQTTTFPLQSQVPSSVTGSLFSHRFPLQSQVPSSVTGSLFSHRFPLQSQVPSSVTGSLFSHRFRLQSQVPSLVTGSLFSHRFPLQSQVSSIGHKEGSKCSTKYIHMVVQ